MDRSDIVDLIANAAARVSRDLGESWTYEGEGTGLLSGDALTSLTMVSLVVEVEQELEDRSGKPISLASDAFLSSTRSPLSTIGTFADLITERLSSGA
jgi:hypothetical protein